MKGPRRGNHVNSTQPWKVSHLAYIIALLLIILYSTWLIPLVWHHGPFINTAESIASVKRGTDSKPVPTTADHAIPLKSSSPAINLSSTVATAPASPTTEIAYREFDRARKERYIREAVAHTKPAPVVISSPVGSDMQQRLNESPPLIGKTLSQPHPFPAPLTYSSRSSASTGNEPAVLVVCGTDGSGTRRVVQVLTQLGVAMVSEDPETYDIHADSVKGWPEVVRPVIAHTQSLIYEPTDLPEPLQSETRSRLRRILQQLEVDSAKPTSYRLAVGGVLQRNEKATARRVKYGFKAPVAMTLGPWWADGLPHLKIVHVVRDGRDISFSANQGPVVKFYAAMYPSASGKGLPDAVKSIKLWSDWNTQLHDWAQQYSSSERASDRGSFGYFVVHAEELVHPSPVVRFAAMQQLAEFVGSTVSMDELCCMAQRSTDFMGSHDRAKVKKQQAEAQLASRYGKWKTKLAHNSALSASIHRNGADGLRLFGYEPMREMAGAGMTSAAGYECLLQTYGGESATSATRFLVNPQCLEQEEQLLRASAADYAVTGMCDAVYGVDYKAGDIEAMSVTPGSKSACCRKCQRTEGCRHFTVDPAAQMCYLKSAAVQGTVPNSKLISGSIIL